MPGAVEWEESEAQKRWREKMDEDGRHQRLSQLSTATDGDMRVIGTIERGVLQRQHEDEERRQLLSTPQDGAGGVRQQEREREFRIQSMLAHLDEMAGRPAEMEQLLKTRAKLVAPRTPATVGLVEGPLGNKLEPLSPGMTVGGGSNPKTRSPKRRSPKRRGPAMGDAQSRRAASRNGTAEGDTDAAKATNQGRSADALRSAFDALDMDGDGKLGIGDLFAAYTLLKTPQTRKVLGERIFEVDDDGDGKIGWEECANLYVRGKKPLERIHAGEAAARPV